MRGGGSLVFTLMFASSCQAYSGSTHEDMVKALSDSSWEVRRGAADAMRHDRSFGTDGVPALLAAAESEGNVDALGAELIALGSSGSPDAETLICKYVRSTSPDLQRWATKAFYLWFPQNADRKGCER
jgi:hypothetical protein